MTGSGTLNRKQEFVVMWEGFVPNLFTFKYHFPLQDGGCFNV